MTFGSPVVGGTTLIRAAIHSPDFVAGVSGWTINRDGSAEFNDVVIRGTVVAGGGAVTLDDTGLTVITATRKVDINTTQGLIIHSIPDDGSFGQIVPTAIVLNEIDPSPLGVAIDECLIFVGYIDSGLATEQPFLSLQTPQYTGKNGPAINMYAQAANDANPDNTSHIDINGAPVINVTDRVVNATTQMDYASSQLFNANINVVAGNILVNATIVYPLAFPVGRTLMGFCNLASAAAGARHWRANWIPIDNTQFSLQVTNDLAAGAPDTRTLTFNMAVFVI
jgi:hypothetical protein